MTTRQIQDARHREAVRTYYATGNEALLGPMLAELRPRLLDFLKGKNLQGPDRRADLVQEALVTVLTQLRAHKYTATGSVTSWAMAICWHCFTTSYKSKKHKPSEPGVDENPFLLLPASLAVPAEELPVRQEDEQRAGSVVAAATHAVLGLEPSARTCVLLTYYQGLSQADAAAQLGIAETTFRARLRRGIADLQAWGQRHAHLAPAADVYAALVRVDSGNLFREPLRLAS
jgi:RNA polymerase sigma factor (sigma-70 family)